MIRKKPFIKTLFCCCMIVLITAAINSQIEAQDGLSPLYNFWKNPLPGIPLNVLQDVNFPPLTGRPYQVGRISFPVVYQDGTEDIYDSNYVFGGAGNAPRKFMVWIHYPADLTLNSVPAPYIPDALASAMQAEGVVADAADFAKIYPNAYENAMLSGAQAFYPVLIFSHGKNMHPLFYTAMLEELASQGYIVVSIAHPHDAPASVFPPSDDYPDGDVLVTPNGDENPYIEGVVATNPDELTLYEIKSRPKDVLLTLLYLAMMNNGFPDSTMFTGHLDLTNVGMFGHSFGAGTAAWASQFYNQLEPTDPLKAQTQLKAMIAIDPTIVPLENPANLLNQQATPSLKQAVMFMNGSGVDCTSPVLLAIDPDYCSTLHQANCMNVSYAMQSFPFHFFELDTSTHQTYVSDLVLVAPYLKNFNPLITVPIVGIPNELAVQIINEYIVAFFDQNLNGGNPVGPLPVELSEEDAERVKYFYQPLTPPIPDCQSSLPPPPPPSTIPEPGTIVLFGLGLLGLLELIRRKRQR